MSIAVPLEELHEQMASFTTDAYLLTVGDDGRTHSVAVPVRWSGDELVVPAGNTTAANASARPLVALLWPPPERGGFSLIVDATVVEAENEITLRPTRAVLHRPPPSRLGERV